MSTEDVHHVMCGAQVQEDGSIEKGIEPTFGLRFSLFFGAARSRGLRSPELVSCSLAAAIFADH